MKALSAESLDPGLMAAALVALKILGWAAVVLVLSLLGWSISSLHVLAGWSAGELATRLGIVRGILASVGAGATVVFGGLYMELPIVLICLGVFGAGMAGERFLMPFFESVLGRFTAVFSAAFGNRGNGNGGGK